MKQKELETSTLKELISVNGFNSLWFIILAVGGLFLLVFFMHIGYFPELDLSSTLSLLAAVSLVGLMLTFSLFILTGYSGLTMYFWFKEIDAKQRGLITGITAFLGATGFYTWWVVFSLSDVSPIVRNCSLSVFVLALLFAIFKIRSLHNKNTEKSLNWWFMIPSALLIGVMASMYLALIFLSIYQEPTHAINESGQWLIFGFWLLLQTFFMGMIASQNTKTMLI